MSYRLLVAALALALSGGLFAAQEPEGNAPAKAKKPAAADGKVIGDLAALGPGVHKIKSDKKGRIQSAIVIGQSRISTVLGHAKGLQDARTKSRLAAEAEFVKWLRTEVSVHAKNEEETILFLEGNEENDKGTLKESGKAIEKTSQTFESRAMGLVRGLQVLGVDENAKDKTYTLVLGWSAKLAQATRGVQADNADETASGSTTNGKSKTLKDRRVTAPELDDFVK